MKVIFLDFDGVLNSFVTGGSSIHVHHVRWLNEIVRRSSAHVVISSSWRIGNSITRLRRTLRGEGFRGRVLGKTPDLGGHWRPSACGGGRVWVEGRPRGDEIDAWLRGDPRFIESFVILDDDSDMSHHLSRLVKTSCATGLGEEHVEKALEVLNTPWGR